MAATLFTTSETQPKTTRESTLCRDVSWRLKLVRMRLGRRASAGPHQLLARCTQQLGAAGKPRSFLHSREAFARPYSYG